jgi:hypothetical protein
MTTIDKKLVLSCLMIFFTNQFINYIQFQHKKTLVQRSKTGTVFKLICTIAKETSE